MAPPVGVLPPDRIPQDQRSGGVRSAVIAPETSTETSSPTDAGSEGPGPAEASPRGIGLGPVLAGVAALWGLLIGMGPLYDNSFLTHLATGRLILERGGIPRADPYSFTALGDPWTVQSWLASVVYAGAEELAGLGGVRLVHGVLCAGLALAIWTLSGRSRSIVVRGGVTVLVLVAGSELWTGRPLLYGLVGLATVLLALDGRLDPRWLVPIGWVWVNTHGSFPFAVLVAVLVAVGARIDRGSWGCELRVAGWAAAGIAVGAINPLGPRLVLFPLSVGSRSEAFRSVAEWQPPRFQYPEELLAVGLVLLAVLGLVLRPRWRDALPLVVFAGMALTASRNLAPLVVVLTPILAGAIVHLGPDVDSVRRPSLRVAAAMVAVLAVVFAGVALTQPHESLTAYPVDAVTWMEDEGLWDGDSRVVAPDRVGNLREARAGDEAHVFIDDRVDMFPISLIRDYQELLTAGPGWPEVLDRHGATAVLWEADTPLGGALLLSDDWEVVHRDSLWVVVVPSGSR